MSIQYNRTKDVHFSLTARLLHISVSQYRFDQSNGLRLLAYNVILTDDDDNTRVRYQNTVYIKCTSQSKRCPTQKVTCALNWKPWLWVIWRRGDITPRIFNLALYGHESSASCFGYFTARGKANCTHWKEGTGWTQSWSGCPTGFFPHAWHHTLVPKLPSL